MTEDAFPAVLDQLVQAPVPAGAGLLADALRERFGATLAAVLFYGSNLRRQDDSEGLLDLYALVDSYRAAHGQGLSALANWLLPPNVYYLHLARAPGPPLRAKVAVVSVADFARGTSARSFESYFWGRFCQACALVYVRDPPARQRVLGALAQAHRSALAKAAPLLPATGTLETLWSGVLGACYRAELRPERPGAAQSITQAGASWYTAISPEAGRALPALALKGDAYTLELPAAARQVGRLRWALRRTHGKTRNVARLLKAAATFAGGVDYVLWKLERHTGAPIPRTRLLLRAPLLGIWPVAWRAYRRGRLR